MFSEEFRDKDPTDLNIANFLTNCLHFYMNEENLNSGSTDKPGKLALIFKLSRLIPLYWTVEYVQAMYSKGAYNTKYNGQCDGENVWLHIGKYWAHGDRVFFARFAPE